MTNSSVLNVMSAAKHAGVSYQCVEKPKGKLF